MSNAVAGGGGVAKQQTQASASQQSSHPRGLEVPSRCTPKMVPQANPRTSNMVPSSAKTKEKQQVSVTTSLLAKDGIERTYYYCATS